MHKKKAIPYSDDFPLKTIAEFRGVPNPIFEKQKSHPVDFSTILPRILQKTAASSVLETLQNHWNDWFQGTIFQNAIPERIDRWKELWVRAPNAIVRQQLQFQSEKFLNVINALLPEKIQSVHWK